MEDKKEGMAFDVVRNHILEVALGKAAAQEAFIKTYLEKSGAKIEDLELHVQDQAVECGVILRRVSIEPKVRKTAEPGFTPSQREALKAYAEASKAAIAELEKLIEVGDGKGI